MLEKFPFFKLTKSRAIVVVPISTETPYPSLKFFSKSGRFPSVNIFNPSVFSAIVTTISPLISYSQLSLKI